MERFLYRLLQILEDNAARARKALGVTNEDTLNWMSNNKDEVKDALDLTPRSPGGAITYRIIDDESQN